MLGERDRPRASMSGAYLLEYGKKTVSAIVRSDVQAAPLAATTDVNVFHTILTSSHRHLLRAYSTSYRARVSKLIALRPFTWPAVFGRVERIWRGLP